MPASDTFRLAKRPEIDFALRTVAFWPCFTFTESAKFSLPESLTAPSTTKGLSKFRAKVLLQKIGLHDPLPGKGPPDRTSTHLMDSIAPPRRISCPWGVIRNSFGHGP